MPTFKESHLRSSSDVLARQKAKPVIFLEGDNDYLIFSDNWFLDRLDKLEFKLAEHGQGCTAVCKAVENERKSGVAAFGWVDRDKLLDGPDFALLLETDDAKFEAAQPYMHVKVSLRWELENYLLDPSVLEQKMAAIERQGKRRSSNVMEAELLTHADILVPMAAWNLALHQCGRTAEKDGRSIGCDDRASMEREVLKNLANFPDMSNQYHAILPRVDEFAGAPDWEPKQKLDGLLRIVNGKAMLLRIKSRMRFKVDLTFLLAQDLRQNVPAEIRAFVERCIQAGSLEH